MIDIFQKLGETFSPAAYCSLINVRSRLRGKAHTIAPSSESGIYKVTDKQDVLYICRRTRHNRSKKGIAAGANGLAKQYHLNDLTVNPGDLLIDCGANIGELGVWARKRNLDYIAFEPEQLEARCCDLNAFNGEKKTHNLALWHEDAELDFFSKPGSADSSLFEINSFDGVRKVKAMRLDKVLADIDLNRRVILKIEAEGAEPEVLQGAIGLLPQVHAITVDCGYERGKQQAHTFIEVNNFLSENGFQIEKANFVNRVTMLYRNKKFMS